MSPGQRSVAIHKAEANEIHTLDRHVSQIISNRDLKRAGITCILLTFSSMRTETIRRQRNRDAPGSTNERAHELSVDDKIK